MLSRTKYTITANGGKITNVGKGDFRIDLNTAVLANMRLIQYTSSTDDTGFRKGGILAPKGKSRNFLMGEFLE